MKNKDVNTIIEEAIDSSTRSDDDMMAWVKHVNGNHWVCAASMKGKQVQVFDSSYTNWDDRGITTLQKQFRCNKSSIKFLQMQKQFGGCDCGLFAIANAFTVAFNCNPTDTKYDQSQMRQHLLHCISKNIYFIAFLKM